LQQCPRQKKTHNHRARRNTDRFFFCRKAPKKGKELLAPTFCCFLKQGEKKGGGRPAQPLPLPPGEGEKKKHQIGDGPHPVPPGPGEAHGGKKGEKTCFSIKNRKERKTGPHPKRPFAPQVGKEGGGLGFFSTGERERKAAGAPLRGTPQEGGFVQKKVGWGGNFLPLRDEEKGEK